MSVDKKIFKNLLLPENDYFIVFDESLKNDHITD